jgi:hypothetical protein
MPVQKDVLKEVDVLPRGHLRTVKADIEHDQSVLGKRNLDCCGHGFYSTYMFLYALVLHFDIDIFFDIDICCSRKTNRT